MKSCSGYHVLIRNSKMNCYQAMAHECELMVVLITLCKIMQEKGEIGKTDADVQKYKVGNKG